ncbi:MAG: hypothetical protein AAGI48_14595 [Verrucomicrobiota bacterium]
MKVPLLISLLLCQCAWQPKLAPFHTDGCSLSPERSASGDVNWRACCIEHDLAYWKGGSEEERLAADERLRECMLKETGNARLADTYFEAVRVGGQAHFPTWYRWGYGWNYLRPPDPLTREEQSMVERRLKDVVIRDGECLSCVKSTPRFGPMHRP